MTLLTAAFDMNDFETQETLILGFLFGSPGVGELILIGVVAVLLFGSKLPEVARSLGSSYQQFRKGLSDIQSSIKEDMDSVQQSVDLLPDYSDFNEDNDEPTSPKFEPPEDED